MMNVESFKKWILDKTYIFLLAPALLYLLFFLVFPIAWLARTSFNQNIQGGYMRIAWTLENYKNFLSDPWYLKNILLFSLKIAFITSLISVFLAYPISLFIVKSNIRLKSLLYAISISPLFMSAVCLSMGFIIIFRSEGFLNQFTKWIGLTPEPVKYMYAPIGVIIVLIFVSIPYAVLNLLDSLSRINPSLEEAALTVGANPLQSFLKIIFPITIPGMFAGSLIIFSLNSCSFAVPLMIGGDRMPLIGLYAYREAFELNNMPFAAAISIIILFINSTIIISYSKWINKIFFKKLGV